MFHYWLINATCTCTHTYTQTHTAESTDPRRLPACVMMGWLKPVVTLWNCDYSVFSKAGFSDSAAPQVFLLVEKLSRTHVQHQETPSAPHAASVTRDHIGEAEDDDTGEHTCGGQLVTAQMLADVTRGHAELQAAAAGDRGAKWRESCSYTWSVQTLPAPPRCLLWVLNVLLFSGGNKKSAWELSDEGALAKAQ